MGYIDLIPDVFRLTMPDLATGKSYHTQKFNVGNKQCIGVTIKASQALSVAVAYGIATDTAAAAGVDIAASLPYKTSATSFASNTSTEGGTYHEIAVPPHARQAQLVISNASGSTVSGAVIDAALRVVAYPAASGSGSSDFASITGWPGSSSQFVHADGSYSPISAADIPNLAASKITTGQLALARGGTNADLSATGGTGQVLKQTSAGGAVTVAALTAGDMPVTPYALATKSAQTINNLSNDALTFAAASVNTTGLTYSGGTWTATIAGWYQFEFNWNGNNGTASVLHLYKNGSANPCGIAQTMNANARPRLVSRVYLGVGESATPRSEVVGANVDISAGSGAIGYILITYEGP